ncbi:15550_t:CDS:2 [Acaulospora morrowiae]|uniref:15550_t:CDS:1 n=1 Tax=Acaulospora morrowiae TaxID=94023 RepID=A0A9N8Z835_9GLOM|nr:15550_t:CDS:2 [Acaulospora morrowiae]
MHKLDLANYPVADTLKMLASLLEKITSANDQLKSTHSVSHSETTSSSVSTVSTTPSFTRFHARTVPSIDIHSYLSRILKYCPTTNECFLSLLVYFDRMSKNASATNSGKAFSIDSFNIHRLIIAGIMVSSKFFSDVFFTNSRYAKNSIGHDEKYRHPCNLLNSITLRAHDDFIIFMQKLIDPNSDSLVKRNLETHQVQQRESVSIHVLLMVGGLPVSELNQLELEFLVLNDFRLAITVEELQRYGDQLLKHWTMEDGSRPGGSIYENIRYPNGISNIQYKRTRRLHSTDDTNTSKGGGSKAMKEEDQSEHRSHRRENSFSSTRSLNISYQSSLTSSPQQYSTHLPKTPPPPLSGSSPSSFTSTSNGSHPPINGSPMNSPFTHYPHYHHLHKPYPHHQSQHHRSMSLGSTIKRANSSGSLLGRARDLSEDLQQYHQRHSSPKPINPEDHAYRNAAPSPYHSTTSIPSSIPSNNRGGPQNLVAPSPTHKITSLMRRMSHDSPANSFQYPLPSAYHYTAYPPPPPPPSTQSLPATPVSTLPPPISGISFNPAAIGSVAHSAAVAALGYARRASLALPPLPRHLGFHNNVPPSVPTVTTENPGLVRRGSVPAWSGSSLSNGNNNNNTNGTNGNSVNGNGGGGVHQEFKVSNSNMSLGNGPSSLSSSVSSNSVNGHGLNNAVHGSPSTEFTKRSSWVVVPNHSQSSNSSIGQYSNNNHVNHLNYQHSHHNYHTQHSQHPQSHGPGNASRSSSSDSCHSSSTTGSASDTSGVSGVDSSIAASRGATDENENQNINGTHKHPDN